MQLTQSLIKRQHAFKLAAQTVRLRVHARGFVEEGGFSPALKTAKAPAPIVMQAPNTIAWIPMAVFSQSLLPKTQWILVFSRFIGVHRTSASVGVKLGVLGEPAHAYVLHD